MAYVKCPSIVCLPPGVVEYKVPPGVDEYTSGNCDASVTSTRFDGITWACEQACRAIGDADIISSMCKYSGPVKLCKKIVNNFLLRTS